MRANAPQLPAIAPRSFQIAHTLLLSFLLLLGACAHAPGGAPRVAQLPPLQLDEEVLTPDQAILLAPSPDLLALNDQMREFVVRYTSGTPNKRQRLVTLHRSIRGSATLGIDYDPQAGGTATDVFYRGSANCLSYASLFIAMAREAGLDAGYQWLELRPQWTRSGERVLVRLHVNVDVRLGRGLRYMADIDPLAPADVAGTRPLSDDDAVALHHSNIAMQALADSDLKTAWLHAVRALQWSPQQAHLWVNLGVVYRVSGQPDAAEASYLYALQLDNREYSAMNNLVILYGMEGRLQEQARWEQRVARHRVDNPYYHAWLGEQALEEQNPEGALQYYERAVALSPDDSRLLYSLGLVHWELGEPDLALAYVEQAIEAATLFSEISAYRLQLDNWRQGDSSAPLIEG